MGWLPREITAGELERARLDGQDIQDLRRTPTQAMRRRATMEHMGCEAGRALERAMVAGLISDDDVRVIWQVVVSIREVYARYWAAIGAPAPFPQIVRLDASMRGGGGEMTEEQIKRATSAMMRMEGAIAMSPGRDRLRATVLHDRPVRDLWWYVAVLRGIGSVP